MRELNANGYFLHGVVFDGYYKDGGLKECTLTEKNTIETPLGQLIPQYEDDGVRKKFTPSLSFYKSGSLKSVALQAQTEIVTPIGNIQAELVTFYESGALMRVFPLNGKIGGFWTEKNEYGLAVPIHLNMAAGDILCKIICLHFYESGAIKSVTLWPQEKPVVKTPCGEVAVRTGISFYENGSLKSLEPLKPTPISTPIGTIDAFDIDAIGVTGDKNSLIFEQNGSVRQLKTVTQKIMVHAPGVPDKTFAPALVRSHFSDDIKAVRPLCVSFSKGRVFFGDDQDGSVISESLFDILPFRVKGNGNVCEKC